MQKHNSPDDDLFDETIDIDGKIQGKHVYDSYMDDEAWEVDSDAYSRRSVSSNDGFINDGTTDYETSDDGNSDDDF